jgi:ClpP class serine protease
MRTRAFNAVTAEIWAITPEYLRVIAGIAARQNDFQTWKDEDRRTPEQKEADARRALNANFYMGASARTLEGGSGKAAVCDNVAVIPVIGPIFPRASMMTEMSGATALSLLQLDLAAAMNSDKVDSILLAIDSPGGAVSGVSSFSDMLYSVRGQKPLAAHVSGMGASAAYWIASAVDRISLDKTALVGSIGVVVGVPKQVEPDGSGDMVIEIVSSGAPNKRPDPTTPEGYLEIQSSLDQLEAQFIGDVARNRGVSVDQVRESFGKGGVVVGADAIGRKMADAVEPLDASIKRMSRVGKASSGRNRSGQ